MSIIDIPSGKIVTIIDAGTSSDPSAVAVDPDGKSIYVVCKGTNEVLVLETQHYTLTKRIPVGAAPVAITVY